MKKPELVIFDVDGLMLNTEFLWMKAHEVIAERYSVPEVGREMFIRSVGLTAEDFSRVADECMAGIENRYELLEYVRLEGTQLIEDRLDVMQAFGDHEGFLPLFWRSRNNGRNHNARNPCTDRGFDPIDRVFQDQRVMRFH